MKEKDTAQELTDCGAKVLGYMTFDEAHPDYPTKNSHHQNFWWWNSNKESVISATDFSPSTKIEQALTVAFKLDFNVTFIKSGAFPNIKEGKVLFLNRLDSLPDCARKIMEVIKEVEGG